MSAETAPMLDSGDQAATPSATHSSSTEHTLAFQVEPPTPTGPTLHHQQDQRFVDPKEAAATVPEMHDGLFQPPERGHSPADFSSASSLRASPLAYSRHHPYAHSPSSYDDLSAAESYDGGPARSRRTHSHSSRTSYGSPDGDYTPEDDPPYEEEPEMYMEPPMPRQTGKRMTNGGAKDPIRLTATGKPSHARRLPPGHIKRPRNAFILFRSHACVNNLVPSSLNITDHRHISRIVGQMWKNLPPEERKIWEDQAEKEKEEHRRAHPDYKYRPVYRREGIVRRRRRKTTDDKEVEEEERKCEVVARVLLEGGDISEDRVEREIEIQRERDEIEGRVRGPAAKTPARTAAQRRSVPVQPHFDMNYGMVQYGQQMFNPYDMRHANPARSSSMNARYEVDGHHEQMEEDQGDGFGGHGRSHTMPPALHYDQGYYAADGQFAHEEMRGGRAPPPQPLSLYRTGDASLVPPASPGILFGAGADVAGYPATPRTLAMREHQMALQQRLRGSNGTLLSPRAADFGLNARTRPDGTAETMISPTRPFHQDSLGFEHGFLDSALAGEAHGQAQPQGERRDSVELSQQARSFSADDAAEHAKFQQSQTGEEAKQAFSAMGEMAASSGHQKKSSITFQPDEQVTYVYLDAAQAQDSALIESIRAQGFGITLNASQDEIAALSQTTLAAR